MRNRLFECASLLFCAGGGPVRGPKPDAVRPGEVRGRRRQRRVGVSPQQGAPRLSLSHSLTPFRSLTPDRSPIPQDRFMREGAKSLIWNQHSLGRTSDLSAPKDSPGSLEA